MASSQLTVSCDRGEIRVYGGNRSDVKSMKLYYSKLTLEEFLKKHKHLTEEDYRTLNLSTRFNKK